MGGDGASQPVLNLHLFKGNPVFAFSNLAALLNYSATSGVIFLLSLYLQYVQGLSPSQAGLILIAQPVMMTVLSLVAGRLSDRVEPRLLSSAGMALTAVGLFSLATLGETTPLWFIAAVLLMLGTGFGIFSSPNTNAVMSAVDRRFYGVASGNARDDAPDRPDDEHGHCDDRVRRSPGPGPFGAENHAAFVVSVQTAFAVFGLLCSGGVLASLVRGKVRDREPESARAGTARASELGW